jgi:L-lactate dehydrogenase complex protein LldE
MKIQLFVTCLIDSLFPEVGEAVVELLADAGVEVEFPEDQTCCGQPAFNAGFRDEARRMALHTLQVFAATQGPVIIPSGSCAAMLRHGYPELFADDPPNLARANQLAGRVYEFSQFLVDVLGVSAFPKAQPQAVAYHPSCHLLRGLGVDRQPRLLLQAAGMQTQSLEAECCGFGGVFAIDQAELSAAMLQRKLHAIGESGAPTVVACDVSCLMNIEGGLRQQNAAARCAHLAQILAGRQPGLR